MENIINFVKPELLVLVLVLWIVGKALKTSQIKDKHIPAILGACGIALAVVWVLATSPIGTYQEVLSATFTGVTQGIITAGLAVYGNQLLKQAGKEE